MVEHDAWFWHGLAYTSCLEIGSSKKKVQNTKSVKRDNPLLIGSLVHWFINERVNYSGP